MLRERTRCGWRRGPCRRRAELFLVLVPGGKHSAKKRPMSGHGLYGGDQAHQRPPSPPARFQKCIESEKPVFLARENPAIKSIPRYPQDISSAGLRQQPGLAMSFTLSLFLSLFLFLFSFNSHLLFSLPFHPTPLSKTRCCVLTQQVRASISTPTA